MRGSAEFTDTQRFQMSRVHGVSDPRFSSRIAGEISALMLPECTDTRDGKNNWLEGR
jgi:hypothetical protein